MKSQVTDPYKAIRLKCIDCVGGRDPGYTKLIKHCPTKDCWLYPFRLGRSKAPGQTTFLKPLEETKGART